MKSISWDGKYYVITNSPLKDRTLQMTRVFKTPKDIIENGSKSFKEQLYHLANVEVIQLLDKSGLQRVNVNLLY